MIGDIYEFDLAVPQHLGYRVILMETKGIQEYEREYLMSGPNSFVAKNFDEAMKFLNVIT